MFSMMVQLSPSFFVNGSENKSNKFKEEAKESLSIIPDKASAKENTEKRTANSNTFVNEDGSGYSIVTANSQNYQDKDGKWNAIDNNLADGNFGDNFVYQNKANRYDAQFKKKAEGAFLRINQNGHSMKIGIVGSQPVEAKVDQNYISYQNVFENVDLGYTVGEDIVKEDIILNDVPTTKSLTYSIELSEGLRLQSKSDGIEVVDPQNKLVWKLDNPNMIGRINHEPMSGKFSIEKKSDKIFEATIDLQQFLLGSEVGYPLVIDPPIIIPDQSGSVIANASVYEGACDGTISKSNSVMQVGQTTYCGESQSFLKFSLPSLTNIDSAVLGISTNEGNPTITRIRAFKPSTDWSPGTINWDNKPTSTSFTSSASGNLAYNWWNYDVTDLVKEWSTGQPNYGIGLKTQSPTDSRRNFLSSYTVDHYNTAEEHPSAFRPYLIITYGSNLSNQDKDNKLLGIQSWWRYVSTTTGDVNLNVNMANSNLIASFSDLSVDGLGFDTIISHAYNSKKNIDSRFGNNWTISANKRLIISSDRKKVIYSDETDTQFEFNDSNGNGNYVEGILDPSSSNYKSSDHRPNGLNWGLKYDSASHLFKGISSNKVTYTFDESGKIVSEADRNGNTLSYEYTGNQLVAIRNNGSARAVKLYYDGNDRLQRIEDLNYQDPQYKSSGQKITYTYDNGDLKTVSKYSGDTLIGTTTFNYVNHQLSSALDAKNNLTSITTVNGKVTEIIDALTKKTTISYEAPINSQTGLTKVVSAKGNEAGANPLDFTSSYYFSINPFFHYGLVTKEVSVPLKTDTNPTPTAQTTEYDYNDDFKLTSTVDPTGAYDGSSYDDVSGLMVYQMDKQRVPALKNTYNFADYNTGDWRMIDSYNGNGVQTTFYYDTKGNLTKKSVVDGDNINYLHNAGYESVSRVGDADGDGKQDYDTTCNFAPSNQSWHWNDLGDYWCFGGPGDNKVYEISTDKVDGDRSQVIGYAGNTNGKSANAYQDVDDSMKMEPSTTYTLYWKYKQNTDKIKLEVGLYNYNDHNQTDNNFIKAAVGPISYDWNNQSLTFTTPSMVGSYPFYTSEIFMRVITNGSGSITGNAWFDSVKLQKGTVADQQVEKYSGFEYNTQGQVTKERTPEGKEIIYEWDSSGNLLSTKDPLQNITSFTYDLNGNKLSKVEPKGSATTGDQTDFKTNFLYNGQGQITATIDAKNGYRTVYTYDANSDLETSITPNNLKTTYINDKVGRPSETINPYGFKSKVEYDAQGNPKGISDPNGKSSGATYDAADRVEKETDPDGKETATTYDKNDNIKVISKETKTISYNYDKDDKLLSEANNGVQTAAYTYDRVSNLTSATTSSSTVAQNYSLTDEITKVTVAGQNFSYHRNKNNQLTSLDKANGDTVSYGYNNAAQVTSINNTKNGAGIKNYGYEYDANGNRTKVTEDGSKITTYDYDNFNQLKQTTLPDGSYNKYTYDKAGNLVEKYNSSSNNYVGYSYDGNRLISKGNSAGNVEYYGYDANGNITSRDNGEFVNFLSHFNGDLKNSRENLAGLIKDDPKAAASYVTGKYGQALSLTNGNYLTYSSSSNMTKDKGTVEFWLSPNWNSDSSVRTLFEYFADTNNYIRIQKVADNKIQFKYVNAGKDYGTSTTNPVAWTQGNWYKIAVTWETPSVKIFVNDQKAGEKIYCQSTDLYCKNALKPIKAFSQKITFGANLSGAAPAEFADASFDEIRISGLVKSEADLIANYTSATEYNLSQTTTYEYDSDDYLNKITKPGNIIINYTYDANKRLTKRSVTGQADVNYEYDGDKIVAEKNSAGVVSTKYIYDAEGALLYIEQGANKYYPIEDGLGSIVMLRDQNGVTVATYEYDDWGKLTNKTGSANSNLQFASYFWDNDAQLYHLGARWYDPTLARFVSVDPHPGDSDDSMSQNEYLYCRNNPVNYTDPDGDYVETALDIASVAYSANEFKKNRSFGNAGWLAFDAAMVLLPIAPGSGVVRAGIKARKGGKAVKKMEFTGHATKRMAQRNISKKTIQTVIKKGKQYYDPKYNTKVYHYNSVAVAKLNKGKGAINTVITKIPKPTKRWIKWKKR